MNKRISSVLILIFLFIFFSIPIMAETDNTGFSDVFTDDWYAEAVIYCRDNGLMSGTTSSDFSPEKLTSRAMLATILYRYAGSPTITQEINFSDTEKNTWYSNAISWAVENKIVSGYYNGNFGPNDWVTREQFAAILWRNAGNPDIKETPSDFKDENKISSFAVNAVDWAQEKGVITGKANNHFDPKGEVTRAEAAVMLYRYLNTKTEHIADNSDNSSSIPDGDEDSMINLTITIQNRTFAIKLYNNETTQALIEHLPMTINMGELNGNEKYYFLSSTLPASPQRPGQIKNGDFMLYGNNCLVLFYESFSSSYNYTRLGYIEDVTGLKNALGDDSVEVTFQK